VDVLVDVVLELSERVVERSGRIARPLGRHVTVGELADACQVCADRLVVFHETGYVETSPPFERSGEEIDLLDNRHGFRFSYGQGNPSRDSVHER